MGQQQLILLVLATVIVGLATIVGIQAFNENNLKSNADAMVQDAVRIANDAQAWKVKPQAMGGQDDALKGTETDFTGATLDLLGYENGTNGYCNLNGCYTLAPTSTELTISGTTANSEGSFSTLTTASTVTVTVTGVTDQDIATTQTLGSY